MKWIPRLILFLLVVVPMGLFMFTYTVRFTETAVVKTFGRAGENSVQREPGLKFRLPVVQDVIKYDNRVRVLQTQSQTQQLADESQVIVEAFAAWRVDDPLRFNQSFSNAGARAEDQYRAAEAILRDALRSAMGATSRYRMDELFTPEPGGSKLPQLEADMHQRLDASSGGGGGVEGAEDRALADYGVEVELVGINRMLLPEETTSNVIERMGAVRDRIKEEIESQGLARAAAIRAQAEGDATKIREFASRRASEIRARGEREAAEYLAAQNENPELAVFLRQLDFMRDALAQRVTLMLSTESFGFELFDPAAVRSAGRGEIPVTLPTDEALFGRAISRSREPAGEAAASAEGAQP